MKKIFILLLVSAAIFAPLQSCTRDVVLDPETIIVEKEIEPMGHYAFEGESFDINSAYVSKSSYGVEFVFAVNYEQPLTSYVALFLASEHCGREVELGGLLNNVDYSLVFEDPLYYYPSSYAPIMAKAKVCDMGEGKWSVSIDATLSGGKSLVLGFEGAPIEIGQ